MFVAGTEARHEPVPLPLVLGHVTGVAGHCAGAQDSLEGALHVPALHVNTAVPVSGAVESVAVAVPFGGVVGTLPLQEVPPDPQGNVVAGQFAVGGGNEHVAPGCCPQAPFEHRKFAEPVAGPVESTSVVVAPSDVCDADAVHVTPPTVQFRLAGAQASFAGGGTTQLAPACCVHVPELQVKVADPVVGGVESVMLLEVPCDPFPIVAVQVLPPTVQPSVVLEHPGGGGIAQVALPCCVHEPFEHRNVAPPIVGAVVSDTLRETPGEVDATPPVQLFPLTSQVKFVAGQLGGGAVAHVAPACCAQVPSSHRNEAEPVSGGVVSDRLRVTPLAAAVIAAEQVEPDTVQDCVPLVQPGAVTTTCVVAVTLGSDGFGPL